MGRFAASFLSTYLIYSSVLLSGPSAVARRIVFLLWPARVLGFPHFRRYIQFPPSTARLGYVYLAIRKNGLRCLSSDLPGAFLQSHPFLLRYGSSSMDDLFMYHFLGPFPCHFTLVKPVCDPFIGSFLYRANRISIAWASSSLLIILMGCFAPCSLAFILLHTQGHIELNFLYLGYPSLKSDR